MTIYLGSLSVLNLSKMLFVLNYSLWHYSLITFSMNAIESNTVMIHYSDPINNSDVNASLNI